MNPTQLADQLHEYSNPVQLDKIAQVLDILKTSHDFHEVNRAFLEKYDYSWYNKMFTSWSYQDFTFIENHLSHLEYGPPTRGMRGTMDF